MGRRSHKYIQATIPQLDGDFDYISEAQRSLLWRTAKQNGWEADDVKEAIGMRIGTQQRRRRMPSRMARKHLNCFSRTLQALGVWTMYLVIDVESIGLYGEGFAVGCVMVDEHGLELSANYVACPPETAKGDAEDRGWVAEHVLPALPALIPENMTVPTTYSVREVFWGWWLALKKEYPKLRMAADCAYPVETNFLAACVQDMIKRGNKHEQWNAPYPLVEISSVLIAAGMDPLKTYPRLPNEMPVHHPTADARQSARLLFSANQILGEALNLLSREEGGSLE